MHCLISAGPTYEPLDNVRRLTNFSTGRLGALLGNYLVDCGHQVTLLRGHYCTWHGEIKAQKVEEFTTTQDLLQRFRNYAHARVGAIFHAAAVSDYGFGKIYASNEAGELDEVKGGKISTRSGKLFAELVPTPKIIAQLRGLYPTARLVGWKYEVDGKRADALAKAKLQLTECHTNACVANGIAYGDGFGVVRADGTHAHYADMNGLFTSLRDLIVA